LVEHYRSPSNQKRTAELEKQIQTLKEERADLYKTQGQNAQRLLNLNDVLRGHEETAKRNKEEYVSFFKKKKIIGFLYKFDNRLFYFLEFKN